MSGRRPLRSAAAAVAAMVVGVVFSAGAQAAPGDLDPTFSGDGKQTTDFGGAKGVAIQADGKIVAVGLAGGRNDFALARYNPNGTLDPSFSGNGRQRTDFGSRDRANGVAIQADGKIVAVGVGGGGDFAVARYNPNGSLDPSFSGNGRQRTNFMGFDEANGVAIQADGRIVAVGVAGGGATGDDFALARYNPNGSLDPSFSGDGKQTTDFYGFANDEADAVALQANGRIVAVGGVTFEEFGDFALARYNPNGSLDPSFSGDGKQTTDRGAPDFANGAAIQPDGKIVAVGLAGGGPADNDFALARYNPNGSLDTSFSGDGSLRTDFGGFEEANAVALQANGKIVAVGLAGGGATGRDFALARYNPNGIARPELLRQRQAEDQPSRASTRRARWRSRRTARSSRSGAASARIKPPISRLLATWEASHLRRRLLRPVRRGSERQPTSRISSCFAPRGVSRVTCCPARAPRSAFATGLSTEILPSAPIASNR